MPFNSNNPDDNAMNSDFTSDMSASASSSGQEENAPFIVGAETGADDAINAGEDGKSSSKFASGPLLIILVVLIAGAGLFSMRTLGRVSAAGDMNNDLEATIEAFLSGSASGSGNREETSVTELVERNKKVLSVIEKANLDRQFSALDLQRNPFIIESLRSIDPGEEPDPSSQAGAILEQRRSQRKSELEDAIKKLSIKSILMGSQPLANINNKVLTEGDTVDLKIEGAVFHITKIQNASVTVKGEDESLNVSVTVDLSLKRR